METAQNYVFVELFLNDLWVDDQEFLLDLESSGNFKNEWLCFYRCLCVKLILVLLLSFVNFLCLTYH